MVVANPSASLPWGASRSTPGTSRSWRARPGLSKPPVSVHSVDPQCGVDFVGLAKPHKLWITANIVDC